ncbi:GTPase-activating protein AGE2 Ecym_4345 [Eremothecium cymbalariae DBVPG|uniref:Arf-GAP domain-containing protein n=1 Tax=Eremothecium cymbalariae (strain CBS 270.75 / DBVPG 7215 / KCTC 17166 / NRRL Y-17582) TaxID=931890 RepID=G8JTQ3_ERECY|nr:hypothetical protein Ecym_4345 [Eremothecium cymbalariae DBVPG\
MTSVEIRRVLQQLLRDPENQVCADCKSSTHPRWSSWSLGVFVCIKCAGFHRSLGTHISKVKSVDLDTWKEEHLQQLVKFGNNRNANAIYEASLDGNGVGYVPDASKIGQFIKTKYELKKWYGKDVGKGSSCSSSRGKELLQDFDQPPQENNADSVHSTPSSHCSSMNIRTSPAASTGAAVSTQSGHGGAYDLNSRPNLKKSILSLYSRPKQSPSFDLSTSSISSLQNGTAAAHVNVNNSSSLSLEDNELFKNVWT